MPPAVETVPVAGETNLSENSSSKPTVGIIYPPPEVRSKFHFHKTVDCLFYNFLLRYCGQDCQLCCKKWIGVRSTY